MAQPMRYKRSATPSKVPTIYDLKVGEFALNTFDGRLFTKVDDGAGERIVELSGGGGGGGGIEEAPADGKQYARKNEGWEEVSLDDGDTSFAEVAFLSGFEGADGSNSPIPDESPNSHTITFVGQAQLDTADSKFGSSSLLLDGAGDYTTTPAVASLSLLDADFTIEGWMEFNALNTVERGNCLAAQYSNTGNQRGWGLYYNTVSGNELSFLYSTDGSSTSLVSGPWVPSLGQWYHVAACREGDTLRLFIDGELIGSGDVSGVVLFDSSAPLSIGALDTTAGYRRYHNGHIDELRITKGVARYTEAFTPPSEAFPRLGVSGGGIEEAPLDGGLYARKNAGWEELALPAYSGIRMNGASSTVPANGVAAVEFANTEYNEGGWGYSAGEFTVPSDVTKLDVYSTVRTSDQTSQAEMQIDVAADGVNWVNVATSDTDTIATDTLNAVALGIPVVGGTSKVRVRVFSSNSRTVNSGSVTVRAAESARVAQPVTYYNVPMGFTTAPAADEVLLIHAFAEAVGFAADFSGSVSYVGTNPAATLALDVQKNGTSVGTISIATDGTVTFTTAGNAAVSFAAGDVLIIVAPSTADAAVANCAFTLQGEN